VTQVDQTAEQAIIETLLAADPGHGILGRRIRPEPRRRSDCDLRLDHRSARRHHQLHPRPAGRTRRGDCAERSSGKVEQAVGRRPRTRNDPFTGTRGPRRPRLRERPAACASSEARPGCWSCSIGTGFPFRQGDDFQRLPGDAPSAAMPLRDWPAPPWAAAALDLCLRGGRLHRRLLRDRAAALDNAAAGSPTGDRGGGSWSATSPARPTSWNERECVAGAPQRLRPAGRPAGQVQQFLPRRLEGGWRARPSTHWHTQPRRHRPIPPDEGPARALATRNGN